MKSKKGDLNLDLIRNLQAKIQKKIKQDQSTNVQIREIIVSPSLLESQWTSAGEFRYFGPSLPEPTEWPNLPEQSFQSDTSTADILLASIEEKKQEEKKPATERIFEYIQQLAEVAKEIHLADNFTSTNKTEMKEGAENNITRLNFSEFSFYPNNEEGPFSEAQFNDLIKKIIEIAKYFPPNFHLQLSSFPVVDENGHVHNRICYVQWRGRSEDPVITTYNKAFPAKEDIVYYKKNGEHYQNMGIANHEQSLQMIREKNLKFPVLSRMNRENDFLGNASYGGIIPCETKGGVKFITTVSICLDHNLGVEKQKYAQDSLNKRKNLSETETKNITHIITSNTIHVRPEHLLTPRVTHADAHPDNVGVKEAYIDSQVNQAPEKKLLLSKDEVKFGNTVEVGVYTPYQVKAVSGALGLSIDFYNELYAQVNALRQYVNQYPYQITEANKYLVKWMIKHLMRREWKHDLTSEQYKALEDHLTIFANGLEIGVNSDIFSQYMQIYHEAISFSRTAMIDLVMQEMTKENPEIFPTSLLRNRAIQITPGLLANSNIYSYSDMRTNLPKLINDIKSDLGWISAINGTILQPKLEAEYKCFLTPDQFKRLSDEIEKFLVNFKMEDYGEVHILMWEHIEKYITENTDLSEARDQEHLRKLKPIFKKRMENYADFFEYKTQIRVKSQLFYFGMAHHIPFNYHPSEINSMVDGALEKYASNSEEFKLARYFVNTATSRLNITNNNLLEKILIKHIIKKIKEGAVSLSIKSLNYFTEYANIILSVMSYLYSYCLDNCLSQIDYINKHAEAIMEKIGNGADLPQYEKISIIIEEEMAKYVKKNDLETIQHSTHYSVFSEAQKMQSLEMTKEKQDLEEPQVSSQQTSCDNS